MCEWKTIQIAPLVREIHLYVWTRGTGDAGFTTEQRHAELALLQERGDETRVVLGVVGEDGTIEAVEPGETSNRFLVASTDGFWDTGSPRAARLRAWQGLDNPSSESAVGGN